MNKQKPFITAFLIALFLIGSIPPAHAEEKVNVNSVGSVIKEVKRRYENGDDRREISEWLTKVVDDRLINSNSTEWFWRPFYAWVAVAKVRNNPAYGDDYNTQANVAWTMGYGNCGENSIVVYYILKKAGVKEHVRYIQAGKNRSHSFTVWGMPPDAITQNPDTWGDALVVDPWVGDVLDKDDVKSNIWFQNGKPDTPLHDSSVSVDGEAEDWNLIWRNEMVRTGQLGKKTAPSSANTSVDDWLADCFIATAVYGTPMNGEIQALRYYRDNTLKKHTLGRMFVTTYEALGPVAAFYIKQDDGRRLWAREHIVEPALEFIKYNE